MRRFLLDFDGLKNDYNPQSMFTLNVLEIVTNKTEISIYSTLFDGNREKVKSLRSGFPTYNFYWWFDKQKNENKIYCWSKVLNNVVSLPPGFSPQKVSSETHPPVWNKILEEAFIHLFKENDREIFRRRHSYIWELAMKTDEDQPVFKGDGLVLNPYLKFSFHCLKSSITQKNVFCISVRKTFKPKLTFSDEEYLHKKIDTRNWDRNARNVIVPSFKNIKKLLAATGQERKYQRFKNSVYSNATEYKALTELHADFQKILQKIHLPDDLEVFNLLLTNLPNATFEHSFIGKPEYFFHNERTGRGLYNQRLQDLRPASYDFFKNKEIRLLVLTPSAYEGSAGSFSAELLKELRKTFHLNGVISELRSFDHRQPRAYSNLLRDLDVRDYDLVLQVVSERDKSRKIKESPYFVFKAKMLNQGVPSQKVLIETIRQADENIMSAIALNVYSKLGGTAWSVEKDEKDRTEIIIGIGSTVDFWQRRIMSFANVLDYRGSYITGDCTQLSDMNDYRTNLETHLVKTISEVIKAKNIQENDPFRLIFHLTKEAGKRNEIAAIENALKHFEAYQIQFAIVHLSYGHNFRIFKNEGREIADRGTYIQLSNHLALLHLGKPSKTPILVRLDWRSTYQDLYAATKQILFFAHLSHRSFRPGSKPVTIQYPSLMAKLTNELSQVPDWDKDMLNKQKDQLWFI